MKTIEEEKKYFREYQKKRYWKNPEKSRKYSREQARKWWKTPAGEKRRKYIKTIRPKINAQCRIWRKTPQGKKCAKKYIETHPWVRTLVSIKARCRDKNHWYYKNGIKNFLNNDGIKYLWFRDKAWLLKQPSIDRIAFPGHYTIDNCRFIELEDNYHKRPIAQMTLENKIIKRYESITKAAKQYPFTIGALSHALNGRCETSNGYKWKYIKIYKEK